MAVKERTHRAGHALAAGLVFLAMLLAAFSLWTAIPLSWVYIASKLAHSQFADGSAPRAFQAMRKMRSG